MLHQEWPHLDLVKPTSFQRDDGGLLGIDYHREEFRFRIVIKEWWVWFRVILATSQIREAEAFLSILDEVYFQWDLKVVGDLHRGADDQVLDPILRLGLENDLQTLLVIDILSLASLGVQVKLEDRAFIFSLVGAFLDDLDVDFLRLTPQVLQVLPSVSRDWFDWLYSDRVFFVIKATLIDIVEGIISHDSADWPNLRSGVIGIDFWVIFILLMAPRTCKAKDLGD